MNGFDNATLHLPKWPRVLPHGKHHFEQVHDASPARWSRAKRCGMGSSIRAFGEFPREQMCCTVRAASRTNRVSFRDFKMSTRVKVRKPSSDQKDSFKWPGFECIAERKSRRARHFSSESDCESISVSWTESILV